MVFLVGASKFPTEYCVLQIAALVVLFYLVIVTERQPTINFAVEETEEDREATYTYTNIFHTSTAVRQAQCPPRQRVFQKNIF